MAYTHITFTQLRAQLASRLADSTSVFWTDTELTVLMTEAFRTFGFLSGFWRARGQFLTVASQAFYVLSTVLTDLAAIQLVGYSVTDRNLVQSLQFALLESATSQSAWSGTEMFTLDLLRYSIQRRRDQFLADTGIRPERITQSGLTDINGRLDLADTIMDVRRAAWQDTASSQITPVWREDEFSLDASNRSWIQPTTPPTSFSVMAPPPLTLQLAHPPSLDGTLDLIVTKNGPDLNPASAATILQIPDDLTPAIKWGALADLLSMDGPARDPDRAQYCESRYQQFVQLARIMSTYVHSEINSSTLYSGAVLYADNFNRADGFVYTGNICWQFDTEENQTFNITSNRLRILCNDSAPRPLPFIWVPNGLYDTTLPRLTNQFAEMTFKAKISGTSWSGGPLVMDDGPGFPFSNGGYGINLTNAGGGQGWVLNRYFSTGPNYGASIIASGSLPTIITNGDVLRLEFVSGQLIVRFNGVSQGSFTPDVLLASGYPGVYHGGGSFGSNATEWDNWRGGSMPEVISTTNQSVIPCTLQEMDSSTPLWQNTIGTPTDLVMVGPNLAALYPVPDGIYLVGMDVVRRTPIPADSDNVQLGREQLDMILDYAEHLALFKVGGQEWMATKQQADNFMLQSITYNQRLAASARYIIAPKELSQKEKQERPRRLKADGLGTLVSKDS